MGHCVPIYHNLPFLNVFNTKGLVNAKKFSRWSFDRNEPDTLSIGDLDYQRLKMTSIDYTLCDQSDRPLVCIEFDGLKDGYNVGTEYRFDGPPDPWREFTGLIPDLDHYKGSFGGRVFPLWHNRQADQPNMPLGLLTFLGRRYRRAVNAEDLMAYLAAVAAHPAFAARFASELAQPGLRIPLTASGATFAAAVDMGRTILWLHTFGERFADPGRGRPAQPPRLPPSEAPRIPTAHAIPQNPASMPDAIDYDAANGRLLIGIGYVENVTQQMWAYEVSGKHVLRQWFSYRKAHRERPIIGDRRTPSKLGEIQPDHWLAEYTTELLNVLHVLGLLIVFVPQQAKLLERICSGRMISADELRAADALAPAAGSARATGTATLPDHPTLFDEPSPSRSA